MEVTMNYDKEIIDLEKEIISIEYCGSNGDLISINWGKNEIIKRIVLGLHELIRKPSINKLLFILEI